MKWCGPDNSSPLSALNHRPPSKKFKKILSHREKELYPLCLMDFSEETGTEEEILLLPMRFDPQTGTTFPGRDIAASEGSGRDIFRCACSGVLAIFLYLAVTQMQSIDEKFHNQLHFKSYMRIPGHDEILLCEGPDMIPVKVDFNAFHSQ